MSAAKGKPDVAVMLGMPKDEGDGDEGGEQSLSEVKARAEDAATAFAAAVAGKDAKKIVTAFCSLQTLCGKLDELKDSGETEEEEPVEVAEEETEEPTEE